MRYTLIRYAAKATNHLPRVALRTFESGHLLLEIHSIKEKPRVRVFPDVRTALEWMEVHQPDDTIEWEGSIW